MGLTPVQGKSANNSSSAAPTIAFTSALGVDNLFIFAVRIASATVTISSVTDTLGSTFVQIGSDIISASRTMRVYYARTGTGGADTITVNLSSAALTNMAVEEYSSELGIGDPTDGTNGATGVSTTPASGSITTTYANDTIVGVLGHNSSTATEDANFTNRSSVNGIRIADRTITANETRQYAPSLSSSVDWECLVVGLEDALAVQDTPELYGRPMGVSGQRQMQQMLTI